METDAEKLRCDLAAERGRADSIRLDLAANLNVPRFLPLGDVGDSMAAGFVNAATRTLGS